MDNDSTYRLNRDLMTSLTPAPGAELGSMLEALTEPAALLSPDYRILAVNHAYLKYYGHDAPVGGRCYEISHGYSAPCDQAGESCPLKGCQQTGSRQRVLHLHNTRHGEEHVDVEMVPVFNEQQRTEYFLEIIHLVRGACADAQGEGLVGRSAAFNQMLSMIQRAAPSEISVLLQGESGTGKELVARAVHESSRRSNRPFVTVECSGLSENLFESELFGHERGAFTGAVSRKSGLVSAAHGGTLFLDEIGEVPLGLQVKLLRLIETGNYRTVGGLELQHADFRLVCATHRDLEAMVEQGTFRQDLYYRISTFPIGLPRLAERWEDLPLLCEVLLRRISGAGQVQVSESALAVLRGYGFPGNIRELRNLLERAVLLTDDHTIRPEHLPARLSVREPVIVDVADEQPVAVLTLAEQERHYLRQLHQLFAGDNRALAARLGISERTLYRKLSQLK